MEKYYNSASKIHFNSVVSTAAGITFSSELAEREVMIKAKNLYSWAWTPLFRLKIEGMACNNLPIAAGTAETMNFLLTTLIDIDGGPVANSASYFPDIVLDLKTAAVTFDASCPPSTYVLDSVVESNDSPADASLTSFFSIDVATGIFKASGYHTLATA